MSTPITKKFQDIKYTCSPEKLEELLSTTQTIYWGIDTTAESLHVGHLVPCSIVKHLSDMGHKIIVVGGGGTTVIGDPTDKEKQRPILDDATIQRNCKNILKQMKQLVPKAEFVDNSTWLSPLTLIDFIKTTAKFFSVNQLIKLDTFARRLNNDQHLSFMEIMYPLVVAYDFYYLHKHYNCTMQMGGIDQWGNITQSVQYLKRLDIDTYGIFSPLLVTKSGTKMSKSTSGAVWLDPKLNSSYDFWQYWRNIEDDKLEQLLKMFTDTDTSTIQTFLSSTAGTNEGKKLLATKITTWVHGADTAQQALQQSNAIFENHNTEDVSTVQISPQTSLPELLIQIKTAKSISDAKRKITQGMIQIDGHKVTDPKHVLKNHSVVSIAKKTCLRIQLT